MDLHDGYERRVQIIRFGFLCVQNFDRKCSTWDGEDGCFHEILRKLDGIKRCRRHNPILIE